MPQISLFAVLYIVPISDWQEKALFVLIVIVVIASFMLYTRIRMVNDKNRQLRSERNKYKRLIYNIFPQKIAEEILADGYVEARRYTEATVLFTDFVGFTSYSESVKPMELVRQLDEIFSMFDSIILHQNVEKIKTTGDSYMCVAGVPVASETQAEDMVRVALEFREYVALYRKIKKYEGKDFPNIRIGIHTGPVVAGMVGVSRMVYDVWGDTVNVAQRTEAASESGRVNISEALYEKVKDKFRFTERGIVEMKGKQPMRMYFVDEEI